MNIIIIPGLIGYPEEKTFEDLTVLLEQQRHTVMKIAWPHFPTDLSKYNFTSTLDYAREVSKKLDMKETVILGFSMGGVIATQLASEFHPKKLGLMVTPYQAGSEDDLEGKYKDWKESGYRDITSSRFGELRIPFTFIEDARKYNALETITNVNCPVLFVVGKNDDKVPNHVTRKLYDKAKEPKQWIEFPDMEHKYQYQPEMLEKVNKVLVDYII